MAERPTHRIELTKAQQLEVLAATGLLLKTLAVPAAGEDEEATARLPLPEWLTKRTATDGE